MSGGNTVLFTPAVHLFLEFYIKTHLLFYRLIEYDILLHFKLPNIYIVYKIRSSTYNS